MEFRNWLNEMAIRPNRTEPYKVGEILTVVNPRGETHELEIKKIEGDYAWVSPRGYEHTAKMPIASLKHFVNDLSGNVDAERVSGNPYIDAVVEGRAKYLGKGDDGIAFQVGDMVVKVSTTVPYHPLNPGHRHPTEAMSMMRRETDLANKLIAAGVPGILPAQYYEHGDKAFQVRPFVTVPARFNLRQLTQIRDIMKSLHSLGYALRDEIQAGIYHGRVYLYDLGKAHKASGYDVEDDVSNLKRLYKNNGFDYEPDYGEPLKQEYQMVKNHLDFLGRITNAKNPQKHKANIATFYRRFQRVVQAMHEEFPDFDTSQDESEIQQIINKFGVK